VASGVARKRVARAIAGLSSGGVAVIIAARQRVVGAVPSVSRGLTGGAARQRIVGAVTGMS